jgi:histidinol-phosphate aminotransferase
MKTPTPRDRILDIAPYVPGLSKAQNTKAQQIRKLSANETPFGPSPKAIEAYIKMAHELHRYPHEQPNLIQAIAEVHNLEPAQIVCGAGSDELISLLCLAYAGPGDDVLYSQYGFLMYPISTKAVGANPITAPEQNLKTDVMALLKHVTPKTKIVFIANPNNPTGSYITKDELVYLRNHLPSHILLVLDGAYSEYVAEDDYSDGLEMVKNSTNIVVTRTFSKIYGLANLRVGWCYCPPAIADVLNRVRGPFNVSGPAIASAIAAVHDQTFVEKTKAHNSKWLTWLSKEFSHLGLTAHPSVTNFLLVTFPNNKKTAASAHEFLMEHGIIARPVASYGLPNCLRFTVGLEADNKAVIEVITMFMGK